MPEPAVGSQIYFGTAPETAYGTPVTPNRWFEVLSESLERNNNVITSNGLRGGTRNLRRGSRRVLSSRDATGDVVMEVPTTGFGRWINQLLGGTPTVVQQGTTAAWLQTHTMGDLTGKSQTIQKQLRRADGTVAAPFTFHGAKVMSGGFSISVDQILQASFALDCEDVETATAAAAASYTNAKLFHFKQGALLVAGSLVTNGLSASVTITNPQKRNRYYLGSAGLKKEPVSNDFPTVTGTISAEFDTAATFYDRFAADSAAELILEFVGDVIATGFNETFRIRVPDVRFTGGTPTVGGPDVVVHDVPFEGQFDGTNPGTTITYMSTDTAI